jgi:hypothetical protein
MAEQRLDRHFVEQFPRIFRQVEITRKKILENPAFSVIMKPGFKSNPYQFFPRHV